MKTPVKFLLLTLSFVLSSMEEFQDSNSERLESSGTITTESETTANGKDSRIEDIMALLGKIKTCESYNSTIGELLQTIWEYGKTPNISVLHPNISKEVVDWLKDKLHVDVFQDIVVLSLKNTPSFALLGKKRTNRVEREAILVNDVFERVTKIPEKSHIYLGLSLYPFLTEESRIIDSYHTLPPPPITGPIYKDGGVKKDPILKGPPGGIRLVGEKHPKHARVENDSQ